MKAPDKRSAQLLQSAIKAHQAGQFATARIGYETVLARRPLDPDALHFYGVLKHNLKASEEGVALIRRSLQVAPQNPNAWLNLGNILLEQDKSGEAKAAYEQAAMLAPDLADAHYNLGICLRKIEDAPAAVRALDHAVALRPQHAPSHYQRGIAERDVGDLRAAEANFGRALELNSAYTEVYESLGVLLYRQDRIADAAKVYRAWAAQDPTNSTAAHLAAATSGEGTPERGSDAYVRETFDRFAATFDQKLANLGYRAPTLVVEALSAAVGQDAVLAKVLDAGCGTGLCGELLRSRARHLVGVDLSSGMINAARAKGHYDELHVAELSAFMRTYRDTFDAIISADTFVYFGALEQAFLAAAQCLRRPGTLVFTLEEMPPDDRRDYRLEPHGRYSHRLGYVESALARAGLQCLRHEPQVLRRERGADVSGLVITASFPR
jgi:predicted TPR repeat methyltransferase